MRSSNDFLKGESRLCYADPSMFNRIDRYIAGLFLSYTFGGLLIFMMLFVTVDFMTNVARFNAPGGIVAEYYLLFSPWILVQMIPVACLLGVVFTLSTLNKTNELVALFSTGTSLARINLPILSLVVIISVFSFWMSDRILPVANQKRNYTYYVVMRKKPQLYSTVKTNKIWYRSNNVLFNIRSMEPKSKLAQGLSMYTFDNNWQLLQQTAAKEAVINGRNWELHDGSVTLFTSEDNAPMTQDFVTKTITMDEDASDLQESSTTDSLSVGQLKRFIERNREAGINTLRYEVEYQAKFGFAFASFVMACIGIPFSVGKARSGGMAVNAGICILLAFIYWSGYSSGLALGNYGYLPPILTVC